LNILVFYLIYGIKNYPEYYKILDAILGKFALKYPNIPYRETHTYSTILNNRPFIKVSNLIYKNYTIITKSFDNDVTEISLLMNQKIFDNDVTEISLLMNQK
jgi:hypothetical protein